MKRRRLAVRGAAEVIHRFVRWSLLLWIAGNVVYSFASAAEEAPNGNAARGKLAFEKRCTGCHALDQNREGPRLHDVYGRKVASVAGFDYSTALKSAQLVWDEASLQKWLADPDSLIPGNDMTFHVSNAQERADIIRFLKESAGK
jgi:cytochrome c